MVQVSKIPAAQTVSFETRAGCQATKLTPSEIESRGRLWRLLRILENWQARGMSGAVALSTRDPGHGVIEQPTPTSSQPRRNQSQGHCSFRRMGLSLGQTPQSQAVLVGSRVAPNRSSDLFPTNTRDTHQL